MARPITQEEREILMENPELVMFMPQHAGLRPVVFLLVIPVTTMVVLAGAIWFWKPLFALVEAAPTLTCLACTPREGMTRHTASTASYEGCSRKRV